MDSLVAYGSDEENDYERGTSYGHSVGPSGSGSRRREDDTNYDDVNMDMSEESESEPELPPAEPERQDDRRRHDERFNPREQDRRERRRSPPRGDRRSPRRDDRHRMDRDRSHEGLARRGLLGDRPDSKPDNKVPALMDMKPFVSEPPPARRSQDSRDAVSPRFTERRDDRRDERRDRERDGDRRDDKKDRERERERHGRRDDDKRSGFRDRREQRSRSPTRRNYPPPPYSGPSERRSPPSGEYRPSSYKVNKKLEAMEKMGLQIKTPTGGMATAQQLRAASISGLGGVAPAAARILDQVQKRKLLWSNKNKSEAEEAAKWTNTRFAQDTDGKQASKFMRLMGIKDPEAVKQTETKKEEDPIKKQEELFQAMQAQYEVARATTHTMRGVGLGFQRGHV